MAIVQSAETALFLQNGLSKHVAISIVGLATALVLQRADRLNGKGAVMERFKAFEDAALLGRLERLDRTEKDLQQRIAQCMSQVEAEGRWLRSDPIFQRLSSVLKNVRDEMRETERELMRRDSVSAAREVA